MSCVSAGPRGCYSVCSYRFEILEQICAAPSVLGQVLDEVRVRRNFKELFIEVPLGKGQR